MSSDMPREWHTLDEKLPGLASVVEATVKAMTCSHSTGSTLFHENDGVRAARTDACARSVRDS